MSRPSSHCLPFVLRDNLGDCEVLGHHKVVVFSGPLHSTAERLSALSLMFLNCHMELVILVKPHVPSFSFHRFELVAGHHFRNPMFKHNS